jgi:hypothetical protein
VLFVVIIFGGLALLFLALIVLGAWNPRRLSELTGKSDEKRWATQATIEEGDVNEMVDAQNESRRRRGKDEVSEADIRERANVTQRESIDRAKREAGD